MFPDLDIGIFVTTNGPAREPDTKTRLSTLLYFIADLLLGHVATVDQSNDCSSSAHMGTSSSFGVFPVYNSLLPFSRSLTATVDSYNSGINRGDDVILSSAAATAEAAVTKCPTGEENGDTRVTRLDLRRYQGVYFNQLFQNANVTFLSENTNLSSSPSSSSHISPCVTSPNSQPRHHHVTSLHIVIGQRFSGVLLLVNETHFEMEPNGIFEFSAHPEENQISRMPVEFSNFDAYGVPYTLSAVWQADEVIQFGRGRSPGCVAPPPPRSSSAPSDTTHRQTLLLVVGIFVLIVTLYNR